MTVSLQRAWAFLRQDATRIPAKAASSLEACIGTKGRRLLCGAVLAASLAGAGLLYDHSRPLAPVYRTESVTTLVPDTIPAQAVLHTVQRGETLWSIVQQAGEPAATTAQRVKAVCAQNAQLAYSATDNRAVRGGRLVHEPDGIACDYLRPGDVLALARTPQQIIYSPLTTTAYREDVPGRSRDAYALFFAALCATSALGAATVLVQKPRASGSVPTASISAPIIDAHEKYKPKAHAAR